MIEIQYGVGYIFDFPLIDYGATPFVADHTPVAGDAKVSGDDLIFTNLTAETIAFTSGSEAPRNGDLLTGATSGQTLRVIGYRLTSGTWAGTDAAGKLFVHSASGVFQAENLNNTSTGTANVLTIGADLDGAGIFQYIANGMNAAGITPTEAQTQYGVLAVRDAAGTEWEDQAIPFKTYGHPLAADPRGVAFAGELDVPATDIASDGTTVNLPTTYDYQSPGNNDDINGAWIDIWDDDGQRDGAYISDYVAVDGVCTLLDALRYDFTGAARVYYAVTLDRNAPVHVMDKLSTLPLSVQEKLDVNTEADAAATGYDAATGAEIAAVITLLGAVDTAAATGAVTDTDNFMAYVKQLVTAILLGVGTDGVTLATAQALYAPNKIVPDAAGTLSALLGIVTDSVNDIAATTTGFTITTTVGTDVRVGMLRFTSGALAGEARLVSLTGTTCAVLSDSSMPAALKAFSAAPANAVTFQFTPLG